MKITEAYRLTVAINDISLQANFGVLPNLTSDVVFGIDLLKQHAFHIDLGTSQVTVTPPSSACSPLGLTAPPKLSLTAEEEDRLKNFLAVELPKFEAIGSTIPLAYHHINLTQSDPIKQRYQPRNPTMQE